MIQPTRSRLSVPSRFGVTGIIVPFVVACSSGDDGANVTASTGGNTAVSTTVPTQASGGATATGGITSTIGVIATGGIIETVGLTGNGGTTPGGVTVTGGAIGTGGTNAGGVPAAVGGVTAAGGSKSSGSSTSSCPESGHVSYTLAKVAAPTAEQQSAYDRIVTAMDTAINYYNCYTSVTKVLNVSYVPTVATADGNINGSIRFGSTASMNKVTAMHEISHTLGIGTAPKWASSVSNGVFTGTAATAQLLALAPTETVVHADNNHFWPFGLNYESEGKTEADLISHCKMVTALRKDLGLN